MTLFGQSGIGAPAMVPEGSQGPIELSAPGSSELSARVVSTGETVQIDLDKSGGGSFVLPAGVSAGEEILVIDPNDPSICAQISIVPASSH